MPKGIYPRKRYDKDGNLIPPKIKITPETTAHLTKGEKIALRWAVKTEHKKNAIKKRMARGQKQRKRRAVIVERSTMLSEPPPADLIKLFGPAQTTLPQEVRPTDHIPYSIADVEPDEFIEEMASQPGFKETMGEAIADPRVSKFLKLIGKVENRSMSSIAFACGLNRSDLAKIWRDSKLTRAFFRIVNRMEPLADKMMDDAMGNRVSCRRCDGFGRIDVPLSMREFFDDQETCVCPNCEGRMTVPTVGSAVDKQLIMEKIGWVKQQRGGVNVNVNMGDHAIGDATEMDGIEGNLVEIRQ